MTVRFFNEDITYEVWKYLSFSSLKIVSEVSKDFLDQYKKMTISDKAMSHYKEIGSFSKFCSAIVDETCKKYGYKTPKFITTFNKCMNFKYNNYAKEYSKSKNIHLISDILVITTHAINRKYNRVIEKLRMIDYTEQNNDGVSLQFFRNIINNHGNTLYKDTLFRSGYSLETGHLLKMLWMHHCYRITNCLTIEYKWRTGEIVSDRKTMLKEYMSVSYFQNKYPNYFTKTLLEDL